MVRTNMTASQGEILSLSYNGYDNDVSRITENVLRRFAADEPIPWPDAAESDAAP